MTILSIDTDAFLEALRTHLTPDHDVTAENHDHQRVKAYERCQAYLEERAKNEVYTDSAPLVFDTSKAVPLTQVAYTLREALDNFMIAVQRGDVAHATFAASSFSLAALEVVAVFRLLDIQGIRLGLNFSDDEGHGNQEDFALDAGDGSGLWRHS